MYIYVKKRKKNKGTKKKDKKYGEVRKDLYTDIYRRAVCLSLFLFRLRGEDNNHNRNSNNRKYTIYI